MGIDILILPKEKFDMIESSSNPKLDLPQNIMETLRPFLLSHHSSAGSIFLLSLFDDHNQILMLPGYVSLVPLFTEKLTTADRALELFCQTNPHFFDTSKMKAGTWNHAGFFHLGENKDEGFVTPRENFVMYYKNYLLNLTITTRNVIDALYYAFARSHCMDLSEKKVILLHPYSHYITLKFHQIYPRSKVLVPFRHPVNVYVSMNKNLVLKTEIRGLNQFINYPDHLHVLCRHVFPLIKNSIEIKSWKLEDLHEYPREVLKQLCRFMEIEYQPCLEKSTIGGKKYWGHNPDPKVRLYGFAPEYHRNDRSRELSRVERIILVTLNYRLNKILNYAMPELKYWEKGLALFYYFGLRPLDVLWMKGDPSSLNLFRFKFLKERLRLIILFCKNIFSRRAYKKIRDSFILIEAINTNQKKL
jgi:hypothetical protein